MVGWIDDDPALLEEHFGSNMFRVAVGIQKEQAPHDQVILSCKVQESIRRRSAYTQELLIVERDVRVSLGERLRIGRDGPGWLDAHPVQNRLNFRLCGQDAGSNGVGKSVQIVAQAEFAKPRAQQDNEPCSQEKVARPPRCSENGMRLWFGHWKPTLPVEFLSNLLHARHT